MLKMDINQFLELPDWKKIELKMTQSKFNSYPIQTQEQEHDRRLSILSICAHFAMQDFDMFINSISQRTLDGLWPTAMELFITPHLLDVMPYTNLLEFGNCYCCQNFQGYNRISYRSVKKSSVIPLFGICVKAKNEGYSRALARVNPNQRCISWNPIVMYEQIIDFRIKNIFKQKRADYSYLDYKKDLATINIWDYFQNRYKAKG
jgi:hypothetical protein